jgi:transposase InsO family protein
MTNWAPVPKIKLAFIQAGKLAQKHLHRALQPRFTAGGTLHAYVTQSLQEVQEIMELRLEEYNPIRPHEALNGFPPWEFALKNR